MDATTRKPETVVTSKAGAKPSQAITVGMAQMAPKLGDVAANLSRHLELIEDARSGGANLVVFPELSMTGYFLKDLVPDVAVRLDSEEVATLAEASKKVDVVAGLVVESDDVRFYNAAIYFSGGRIVHIHRKVYLPTYGLFDEQRYLASGNRFGTFEMPLVGTEQKRPWYGGIAVCEDLWHPSATYLLARQGVDVIICPSASPARGVARGQSLGSQKSYEAMTKTYAQLFTAYVIHCNRVGYEDGVGFWGGSSVVGPDGNLVGTRGSKSEELLYCQLNLSVLRRSRLSNPLLRDERNDVVDAEIERIRSRRPID